MCEVRIKILNPDCEVRGHQMFYLPETAEHFDFTEYDYVVDAVDTVSAKLDIIKRCKVWGVPIISCMGCGNQYRSYKIQAYYVDSKKTSLMAIWLRYTKSATFKDRRIKGVKVLSAPLRSLSCHLIPEGGVAEGKGTAGRVAPGSTPFVPAAAGRAGEVVRIPGGLRFTVECKGGR